MISNIVRKLTTNTPLRGKSSSPSPPVSTGSSALAVAVSPQTKSTTTSTKRRASERQQQAEAQQQQQNQRQAEYRTSQPVIKESDDDSRNTVNGRRMYPRVMNMRSCSGERLQHRSLVGIKSSAANGGSRGVRSSSSNSSSSGGSSAFMSQQSSASSSSSTSPAPFMVNSSSSSAYERNGSHHNTSHLGAAFLGDPFERLFITAAAPNNVEMQCSNESENAVAESLYSNNNINNYNNHISNNSNATHSTSTSAASAAAAAAITTRATTYKQELNYNNSAIEQMTFQAASLSVNSTSCKTASSTSSSSTTTKTSTSTTTTTSTKTTTKTASTQKAGPFADESEYRMTHARRGTALIIHNKIFDRVLAMPRRDGTDTDAANIELALRQLGFDIRLEANLTSKQTRQLIQTWSQADHSDADCFACVIMSHGSEGSVFAVDGELELAELFAPFKSNRTLIGKPKLFFVQACRGLTVMEGVDSAPYEVQYVERIPIEADCLYVYSTVAGYYSWRNSVNGSWFIASLAQTLCEHGHSLELMQLLTRCNRRVAYHYESNTEDKEMHGKRQVPCIVSMLTKELYFRAKTTASTQRSSCM